MRVNRIKVILVIACVSIALTTGVLPAFALTLPTGPTGPSSPHTFFPINMFSGDMSSAFSLSGGEKTPVSSGGTNLDHSFMTQAMNMVPAGDAQTKAQMNAITSMEQNYHPTYATTTTSPSWMSQFVQPTAIDGSSNPAQSAYSTFIKRMPNMTDIYQS